MTAVLFWTFIAALVAGCGIDRHDRRKFEENARRDLAPVSMDRLDREVASVLRDDVFGELDTLWLADRGIDNTRTAGGLR